MWFLVFINSFISVGYDVNRGAAFAPKDAKESRLRAAFCAWHLVSVQLSPFIYSKLDKLC
jgi:hypothetical protein